MHGIGRGGSIFFKLKLICVIASITIAFLWFSLAVSSIAMLRKFASFLIAAESVLTLVLFFAVVALVAIKVMASRLYGDFKPTNEKIADSVHKLFEHLLDKTKILKSQDSFIKCFAIGIIIEFGDLLLEVNRFDSRNIKAFIADIRLFSVGFSEGILDPKKCDKAQASAPQGIMPSDGGLHNDFFHWYDSSGDIRNLVELLTDKCKSLTKDQFMIFSKSIIYAFVAFDRQNLIRGIMLDTHKERQRAIKKVGVDGEASVMHFKSCQQKRKSAYIGVTSSFIAFFGALCLIALTFLAGFACTQGVGTIALSFMIFQSVACLPICFTAIFFMCLYGGLDGKFGMVRSKFWNDILDGFGNIDVLMRSLDSIPMCFGSNQEENLDFNNITLGNGLSDFVNCCSFFLHDGSMGR